MRPAPASASGTLCSPHGPEAVRENNQGGSQRIKIVRLCVGEGLFSR